MSALLAADTLAGEITTGTIQTLVTKPIRRSDIVFGKWLGFALLLFLYLISIAGGIVLSIWIQTGFLAPHLLRGVGLIYLASLLTMSVTMMCSSRFSAMATGATVFGLYGLAFIGGWIEQFGSFARSQTAIQVGIVSSLIFPSESIWRRAAYEMQSPLAGMTGMTPFITISVPSFMMILYSAGYIGLMLLLTWHHFDQRDL
jgi:ABC-type transport system involved in multi-copper enzyme maturation permease subunit